MPTVLEFLSDSLSDAGVMKPGQTPSGTMAQYARRKHAEMVRNWSSNRLRLFFVPEAAYTLVGGQGTYALGPGAADFDTTPGVYVKPVFVQAARVRVGTNRRWPLNMLTRPQWDLNQNKTLQDPDGPLDLFYDFAMAIATINVGPIPSSAQTLWMSQWNPLHEFEQGDESLNVEDFYPKEYIKPMQSGLAIELAGSYNLAVKPGLPAIYQDSIGVVERMNNDKLSGAFGTSRTLEGPVKGDGSPVNGAAR